MHPGAEHAAQGFDLRRRQGRKLQAAADGGVGHQGGFPAGAGQRGQPPPRQRPRIVQKLQRLHKLQKPLHLGDAEPGQQGGGAGFAAGQGGGVGARKGLR